MAGILYIVSTPIGNLKDISQRAIDVLKESDLIACEDSRHTKKLLTHFSINTPLTSYHEHNELTKSQKLLEQLKEGNNIAIVTDAGTPCVSDPGYRVVRLARENSIKIVPVPGASSAIAALTVSGLPSDRFIFLGFLPRTKKQIENLLDHYIHEPSTLIFFESPKRIKKTLTYLSALLGNREAAVCRELTKMHEEIVHGNLETLIEIFDTRKEIKGEITLVIEGYQGDNSKSSEEIKEVVYKRLKKNITNKC